MGDAAAHKNDTGSGECLPMVGALKAIESPVYWQLEQVDLAEIADNGEEYRWPDVTRNDQGWVRKEILRTGQWPLSPPGTKEGDDFAITLEDLSAIKQSFFDGAYERVAVPLGHGPQGADVNWATEHNAGWVRSLEVASRLDGEWGLYAWLEFTDAAIREKIFDGSIWNVSAMLEWGVTRPSDGVVFDLALKHVSLTNYPWVESLAGFSMSEIENETVGVTLTRTEDEKMTKLAKKTDTNTEGAEDVQVQAAVTLEQPQTSVSLEQVQAQATALAGRIAKQQVAFDAREAVMVAMEARTSQLAIRAEQRDRELTLKEVVLSLESPNGGQGVVGIKGYRHYPVVVQAVCDAMAQTTAKAQVVVLAQDGTEQPVSIDSLILSVVNAIPAEARLSLRQQPRVISAALSATSTEMARAPVSEEEFAAAEAELGI